MKTATIKIGAVSAVLAATLIAIQQLNELVFAEPIEITFPIWGSTVYVTQLLLVVAALVGLYLRQRHAFGRLGRAISVVAVFGAASWFGVRTIELVGEIQADGVASDTLAPAQLVAFVASFGLFVVGLMAFAAVTWRAGVLPRQGAALILVGIPLGLALDGVVPGILLLYGAGLAWLGIAAVHSSASAGTRQPLQQTLPRASQM
jgi:hypothetical protein